MGPIEWPLVFKRVAFTILTNLRILCFLLDKCLRMSKKSWGWSSGIFERPKISTDPKTAFGKGKSCLQPRSMTLPTPTKQVGGGWFASRIIGDLFCLQPPKFNMVHLKMMETPSSESAFPLIFRWTILNFRGGTSLSDAEEFLEFYESRVLAPPG